MPHNLDYFNIFVVGIIYFVNGLSFIGSTTLVLLEIRMIALGYK